MQAHRICSLRQGSGCKKILVDGDFVVIRNFVADKDFVVDIDVVGIQGEKSFLVQFQRIYTLSKFREVPTKYCISTIV
jgi:hypothetical protein